MREIKVQRKISRKSSTNESGGSQQVASRRGLSGQLCKHKKKIQHVAYIRANSNSFMNENGKKKTLSRAVLSESSHASCWRVLRSLRDFKILLWKCWCRWVSSSLHSCFKLQFVTKIIEKSFFISQKSAIFEAQSLLHIPRQARPIINHLWMTFFLFFVRSNSDFFCTRRKCYNKQARAIKRIIFSSSFRYHQSVSVSHFFCTIYNVTLVMDARIEDR